MLLLKKDAPLAHKTDRDRNVENQWREWQSSKAPSMTSPGVLSHGDSLRSNTPSALSLELTSILALQTASTDHTLETIATVVVLQSVLGSNLLAVEVGVGHAQAVTSSAFTAINGSLDLSSQDARAEKAQNTNSTVIKTSQQARAPWFSHFKSITVSQ